MAKQILTGQHPSIGIVGYDGRIECSSSEEMVERFEQLAEFYGAEIESKFGPKFGGHFYILNKDIDLSKRSRAYRDSGITTQIVIVSTSSGFCRGEDGQPKAYYRIETKPHGGSHASGAAIRRSIAKSEIHKHRAW